MTDARPYGDCPCGRHLGEGMLLCEVCRYMDPFERIEYHQTRREDRDNEFKQKLESITVQRMMLPETHPDAVYNKWHDRYEESDASLRKRMKEQLGIMELKVNNQTQHPLAYATPGAVGMDLHANLSCERFVNPGERWKINTGISIELPHGYEAQVRGRSGLALHHGIIVPVGTIDQDYRGEIAVIMFNCGKDPFRVMPGDRIAQLVIQPVARVTVVEVTLQELSITDRGANGFGSTGQ